MPTFQTNSNGNDAALSSGTVAAIVVPIVLVCVICCILAAFFYYRQSEAEKEAEIEPSTSLRGIYGSKDAVNIDAESSATLEKYRVSTVARASLAPISSNDGFTSYFNKIRSGLSSKKDVNPDNLGVEEAQAKKEKEVDWFNDLSIYKFYKDKIAERFVVKNDVAPKFRVSRINSEMMTGGAEYLVFDEEISPDMIMKLSATELERYRQSRISRSSKKTISRPGSQTNLTDNRVSDNNSPRTASGSNVPAYEIASIKNKRNNDELVKSSSTFR